MTKYAVTGATGKLGGRVAARLLEQVGVDGFGVCVRSPEKVEDLVRQGVRVARGDYTDPAGLERALTGTRTLLLVSAATGTGLAGGIFFAFSNFVMSALGQVPSTQGAAVMQKINVTVLNPLFFIAFFGTGLVALLAGFATPDPWWSQVSAAADRAGERYHRFPLIQDYMSEMESWYADFQNTGTADGSLVKSGLFLEQFRTVPWAHLDIGGTAYFRKAYPFATRGATGVTHATLVELALAGAKAS